jgi:hypothetical protein
VYPRWPGTLHPPALASQMLVLQVWATTPAKKEEKKIIILHLSLWVVCYFLIKQCTPILKVSNFFKDTFLKKE